MHPGVALALTALLTHIVSTQMTLGGPGRAGPDDSEVLDALAVARAVNAAVT